MHNTIEKNYKIAPSKIHGVGVIAVDNYNEGQWIGTIVILSPIGPELTYLGKHVNHSYQPNSRLVILEKMVDLIATTHILPGEEITADYNDTPYYLAKAEVHFI